MKKLIAIILFIAFLMGLACAHAEEQPAGGDFGQGIREWLAGLNLEKSDYKASFFSGGYKSAEITVRKDQGITEIAVPGSGRMQISESAVIVNMGGRLYSVDLAAMKDTYQTFFAEDKYIDKDIEMLRPWLEKAFRDIILPSVKVNTGRRGFTLHIDAGAEEIRERTYAWLDEFIADRNTVETILNRYGLYLGTMIPGMPQTYEELREAWEKEKTNPDSRWQDFHITADITSARSIYGQNISCVADLYIANAGGARLSFELSVARDGFDLVSSLNVSEGTAISRLHNRSDAYELDLHCHGNKLNGVLATPDDTFTLNAEKKTEEDETTHLTATLNEQRSHGEIMLDAVYDPADSSLKAVLYDMNSDDDSGTPREMATLEVYRRENGIDLALSTDTTRISMHTSSDYYYRHMKINIDNPYSNDLYLDFWIQRSDEGEVRLRLDSNFINAYNPHTYSLYIGKKGMDFSRKSGYGQFCDLALSYSQKPTENGFETEISYLNLYESNPTFNTGNRPTTLKIVREGTGIKADLDWSMYGRQVFTASYVPGILTYTDDSGVYEFRVLENTAEKLVIGMTKDHQQELGSIVLTLKDGCFQGTLTAGDEEKMKIVVEPIEKEPIEVIRLK